MTKCLRCRGVLDENELCRPCIDSDEEREEFLSLRDNVDRHKLCIDCKRLVNISKELSYKHYDPQQVVCENCMRIRRKGMMKIDQ